MQTYTVLPGDTLYGISKQFGISVDDIKRANNLTNNVIAVGQVLQIPSSSSTIIYTVKKGDNLYSIARLYGLSVSELMTLNNLSSTNLSIGQILIIPIGEPIPDTPYFTYTVKAGDSLYSIANRYNTTVDKIKQLNNLASNFLSIGQLLNIPTSNGLQIPVEYQTYIVKSGDSLYSIANRYGMSVDELININNLTSTTLRIGQILRVKSGEAQVPSVIKECFGSGYKEPVYQTYTVRSGDSLYIIARRFNTSVDNLINLNNLTSNNLQIGQILKIKEIIE